VLAALAAVLIGALAAYWLNPPVRLPVLDQVGDEEPLEGDGRPRLKGLTYTQVEDGRRKWTLSAEGVRWDQEAEVAYLDQVRVRFFLKDDGWINLSGDTGSYDRKRQVVTLEGSVRGVSHDGMTLETELLTYSEEREVVETDSLVTISGDRFNVTGKGMVVQVPQEKVTFQSQVDSTFIPEGKGPPPGATAEAPEDNR
jgi:LPS export ABC transporter protein LptC